MGIYNRVRGKQVADLFQKVGSSETPDTTTVTVLDKDSSGDVLLATGTTVPSDAETGFAKGCIFLDTDVSTGNSGFYENVGTNTSCNFDVIGSNPGSGTIDSSEIEDATIVSGDISEEVIQYTTVSLTNSEIKNLNATPIEMVAAPGANKLIEFISASLELIAGSEALTESGDNLAFLYDDANAAKCSQDIECTGFIDQTADTMTNALAKIDVIDASADIQNKNIVLQNLGASGEFAGNASNDATMTVKVAYRVHDFS